MRRLTPVATLSRPDSAQFCAVVVNQAARGSSFARDLPVPARAVLDRAPANRGLRLVVCDLVRQDGGCTRRCTCVRPQTGEVLACQVPQDPLNDWRIFNAGDYLDVAATFWASLDVDLEDP